MFFPRHLSVAAVTKSNVFRLVRTNNSVKLSGPEGKLLKCLADKLKFQFDLLQPSDGEWGSLKNGRWTGIVGMVNRGEVDMGVAYIGVTKDRSEAVDFSYPYATIERTFVIKEPGPMSPLAAYLYPFSENVWILYSFLIIISAILLQKIIFKNASLLVSLILIFSNALSQPIRFSKFSDRKRVVFGLWLTFATIMPFLYKINFLSFLTMPSKMSGIKDFRDLSKAVLNKNFKCLVPKGAADGDLLLKSKIDYLEKLGEIIKQNNWKYGLNEEFNEVIDDSTALIISRQSLQLDFGHMLFNDAEISKDIYGVWSAAIALRKGFCCKGQVNAVIFNIQSAGLHKKWFSDSAFLHNLRRKLSTQHTEQQISLSFEDLKSSLSILSIGLILSFIILLAEIFSVTRFKKEILNVIALKMQNILY